VTDDKAHELPFGVLENQEMGDMVVAIVVKLGAASGSHLFDREERDVISSGGALTP